MPLFGLLTLGCATGHHLRVPVRPSPLHTLKPPRPPGCVSPWW